MSQRDPRILGPLDIVQAYYSVEAVAEFLGVPKSKLHMLRGADGQPVYAASKRLRSGLTSDPRRLFLPFDDAAFLAALAIAGTALGPVARTDLWTNLSGCLIDDMFQEELAAGKRFGPDEPASPERLPPDTPAWFVGEWYVCVYSLKNQSQIALVPDSAALNVNMFRLYWKLIGWSQGQYFNRRSWAERNILLEVE